MTGGSTFQDFFTQTMGEFGAVPKRGLVHVAVASGLSAITDLVHWDRGAKFSNLDYALVGIVILPWLWAAYFTTIKMIDKTSSIVGFVKFTAVIIFTLAPILFSLAVLICTSHAGLDDGFIVFTVAALMLIGLMFVVFLPAWPIAQAISSRFVNPMQIVKATRGYRRSLILVFFVAGSVNKLVPSMSSATNVGEAIALALCSAVVAAATLVLTASIAVTAWKFAVRRDASLAYL